MIGFGALAWLVLACAGDGDTEEPGVTLVATTTILGDVATGVAGDAATIEVLLPIGADPHDYRASARQVAAINEADLVIANGLHLEEGLEDVLEAAIADGANVLEIGPLLDPIPFDRAEEHDHDPGLDPHLWMDPVRMAEAAHLIARALSLVDDTIDWDQSATEYALSLVAADEQIITILAGIPTERRKMVTNHDSLGYFAERYDFEVIGTVVPGGSTLSDPSSTQLADLVALMEREGTNVIFAETTQAHALARAVADELGTEVEVVDLYTGSLGEPGTPAANLPGMLTVNAARIAEALG